MLRILKVFLLALFLGALVPQAGVAHGNHRVVCDLWPPYQYFENGDLTGFSLDVLREVYSKLPRGLEKVQVYPWARVLASFEEGSFDVLVSATYSQERTAYSYYPAEQLVVSPWIIWGREATPLSSLQDLRGKRVGLVIGYYYTQEVWDFLNEECVVVEVASEMQSFGMLDQGRLDYCIAEQYNGAFLVRHFGFSGIYPHRNILIRESGLYALFNKKNVSPRFVDAFSAALKAFKATDRYRELVEQYLLPPTK